jgi:transglutaminase-like putative cysteine protease
LPAVVPEIDRLPSRLDLHRAVEVTVEDRWVLVDATHDSALAAGGLTVSEWNGKLATAPAHPVLGRTLVEGEDNDEIRATQGEINTWVNSCAPEVLKTWRSAYIDWLRNIRIPGD